jgi:hypothetical protein
LTAQNEPCPITQLDPVFGTGYPVKRTGVYVSEVTGSSFTLVTEKGHIEAGAIRFSVGGNDREVTLSIVSEAASGSQIDFLAYVTFGKVLQTDVWGGFLLHARNVFSTSESNVKAHLSYEAWRQPKYKIAPTRDYLSTLQIAAY